MRKLLCLLMKIKWVSPLTETHIKADIHKHRYTEIRIHTLYIIKCMYVQCMYIHIYGNAYTIYIIYILYILYIYIIYIIYIIYMYVYIIILFV